MTKYLWCPKPWVGRKERFDGDSFPTHRHDDSPVSTDLFNWVVRRWESLSVRLRRSLGSAGTTNPLFIKNRLIYRCQDRILPGLSLPQVIEQESPVPTCENKCRWLSFELTRFGISFP